MGVALFIVEQPPLLVQFEQLEGVKGYDPIDRRTNQMHQ